MDEEETDRPIDSAMDAKHPSKEYIRSEWLAVIREHQSTLETGRTLYLTLCGRHAIDIRMLVDDGILLLMENGAINIKESPHVAAFESSAPAAAAVKRTFPGLDVADMNIHDELRLQNPLAFPDNRIKVKFQAAVVNLDYDGSSVIIDGQIIPIRAIGKIAQIQGAKPRPWALLLTLNATISWSRADQLVEQEFLRSHLERCAAAARWLAEVAEDGAETLTKNLISGGLSQRGTAAFHLMLTTARIVEAAAAAGWRADIKAAYFYGIQEDRAPMISWVINFTPLKDASRKQGALIRQALEQFVSCAFDLSPMDD